MSNTTGVRNEGYFLAGEWAERFAIISKVWRLDDTYHVFLHTQYLRRSNVATLLERIDANEAFYLSDCIQSSSTLFNVDYMNCSYEWMKDQPAETEMIISCRITTFRSFACCIIQPRLPYFHDSSKYYALREI